MVARFEERALDPEKHKDEAAEAAQLRARVAELEAELRAKDEFLDQYRKKESQYATLKIEFDKLFDKQAEH